MIYFIQHSINGPVKIGYVKNDIKERMRRMQSETPSQLILLGTMDGNISQEKELHKKFRSLHIQGEWFKIAPELTHYIYKNTTMQKPESFNIEAGVFLDNIIRDIEIDYIKRALFFTNGKKMKAAKLLGLDFRVFRYRIKKYGIT